MTGTPNEPSGKSVELDVNKEAIEHIAKSTHSWFDSYLLSVDTFIQLGIILVAFVLGTLAARAVNKTLTSSIESLRLPGFMRGILHNLRRQARPFLILAFLCICILIHDNSESVTLRFELVDAAARLVGAWIVIRLAVQVVRNKAMRSIISVLVWTITALSIFGVLDDTAMALDGLGVNMGSFRFSALTIVKGLIASLILLYLALSISNLIDRRLNRIENMSRASRLIISKIVRMSLTIFAVFMGISMAGVDLSLFTIFSGAAGIGVGLGLQRGVSNLFSGMMLLFDKTIEPGDVVELSNGTLGVVGQMGGRYTEIVSTDNKSFLIPNENLVTQPVINWSRHRGQVQLGIDFRVDYGNDPHRIIGIAEEAARGVARVLADPPPSCHFNRYWDLGLEFTLRFWIGDAHRGINDIRSDVQLALWDTLDKYNIKIPYGGHATYEFRPVPKAPA